MIKEIHSKFKNTEISKHEYIEQMYVVHNILFEYQPLLKNSEIERIEIDAKNIVFIYKHTGIKFICSIGDKRLAPLDSLNFGEYEREELEMQFRIIKPEWNIIDIGANYGWYALQMAANFSENHIYSFEPIPHTFEQLNKNIVLNNCKNITTINIGLSANSGTFDFYFNPQLSVNASLANVSGDENMQKIVCTVSTLDSEIDKLSIIPHFIKIDIEGAELLALKGGIQTIEKHKPAFFLEMLRKWSAKFNYHPNDIINLLTTKGYSCYTIHGSFLQRTKKVTEETVETNFIFLHSENHSDIIQKLT
ncbi:MAG: FkbM family methyltransferase [Bacteroidota bacterium]|nr:FkbM family methyltransferase [Bacteroidota bacterium]